MCDVPAGMRSTPMWLPSKLFTVSRIWYITGSCSEHPCIHLSCRAIHNELNKCESRRRCCSSAPAARAVDDGLAFGAAALLFRSRVDVEALLGAALPARLQRHIAWWAAVAYVVDQLGGEGAAGAHAAAIS
jgi:hypothetical protein